MLAYCCVPRLVSICCVAKGLRVSQACRRVLELAVIWSGCATLDIQGLGRCLS